MQISEADLKIIHNVSTWYSKKFRHEADELESVAVIAVLEEKIEPKVEDERYRYINTIATNAINRFISEDVTIRIPNRSRATP